MKKLKKEEIKANVALILQDRKNSNLLVDLISSLHHDCKSVITVINGVTRVFDQLIRKGDLDLQYDDNSDPKMTQYREWLAGLYDECFDKMSDLLSSGNDEDNGHRSSRELALVSMMKLLVSYHERNASDKTHWIGEDVKRLRIILRSFIFVSKRNKRIITRFQEYMDYTDVKQHVIQGLFKLLKSTKSEEESHPSSVFLDNVMSVLEVIRFNENRDVGATLICHDPDSGDSIYDYDYSIAQRSFNSLWEEFLKRKLSPELYKRVLLILDQDVMPYLSRPLLLTDFLVDSYNVGGSISLLALSGVFTLIQKYNLEYPDFYTKLYALFTPDVLHAKYKARFFYLADLFLTSTHLPEYLVAAFAKRLSRSALTAPASSTLLVFPFIGNLLLRHKGLLKMIRGDQSYEFDPYDPDEIDPAKCRAIDSQLWELETLTSHVLPQVSASAKFIGKKWPEMEWDLSEVLDTTMQDMMEKEAKKKIFVNVPMTFEKPDGIRFSSNEKLSKYFRFS